MTRAELNKQLIKENTTKTLYNGGALSCHARQIDSYYFINVKLIVAQVPLRACLRGVGGTPDR